MPTCVLGTRFTLGRGSFAKIDGTDNSVSHFCERQAIQPCIQKPDGIPTHFAVVFTVVNVEASRIEIKVFGTPKGDAVFANVLGVFCWIERDDRRVIEATI